MATNFMQLAAIVCTLQQQLSISIINDNSSAPTLSFSYYGEGNNVISLLTIFRCYWPLFFMPLFFQLIIDLINDAGLLVQ